MAGLLFVARVLSWPLVVDAASGLVLDGSHRAVVLAREFGARFAVIQQVALDAPDVRIGTWCRVLEGVSPAQFDHARRVLGLEVSSGDGLRCHYGGRIYARPGSGATEAYHLASELDRMLSSNGRRSRAQLVEDDAAAAWLGAPGVVVLQTPALNKAAVRSVGGALLPPKSTRFLLPYRVLGLAVPLAALGGSRDSLVAELERERARPLACLGPGLAVDRRYPERLWQFAGHRIPDGLFADEAGRRAYADALARAALPDPARCP